MFWPEHSSLELNPWPACRSPEQAWNVSPAFWTHFFTSGNEAVRLGEMNTHTHSANLPPARCLALAMRHRVVCLFVCFDRCMLINYNTACCLQGTPQRQGRGRDVFCLDDIYDSFFPGLAFLQYCASRVFSSCSGRPRGF